MRSASAIAAALLVMGGCRTPESPAVVTVMASDAGSVIAARFDLHSRRDSALRRLPASAQSAIRQYQVASDSARLLNQAFQAERAALNEQAPSFQGADRFSPDYAQRYTKYGERAAKAREMLARRDRMRQRLLRLQAEIRSALTNAPGAAPNGGGAGRSARADDSATVIRRPLRNGNVTLELESGAWWFALEHDAGWISDVQRHDLTAGERDSLILGHERP